MLVLRILIGLGLAYLVLLLLAWRFQDRLAFPAPRASLPDPRQVGVENAETVELVSGDGTKLVGWYLTSTVLHRRAPPGGRTDPGIAVHQCRGDGETPLRATAALPAPSVAGQHRQRQTGPLSHPVVSRRRRSARADGEGHDRGRCRGGTRRGRPD